MSKAPYPKPFPIDEEEGYHWQPESTLREMEAPGSTGWKAILTAIVLGLILLLALTGCCRKTSAPPSVSHSNQQDSIREKVVVRIDTVKITVPVEIPVERIVNVLPDKDTSNLETSMAVSTAFIDSLGFLHHTLDNKAQTIETPVDVTVPVTETTHEEYHNDEKSDTVYVSVPAELTDTQEFLIKTGWVTIFAIGCLIGYAMVKLWLKK